MDQDGEKFSRVTLGRGTYRVGQLFDLLAAFDEVLFVSVCLPSFLPSFLSFFLSFFLFFFLSFFPISKFLAAHSIGYVRSPYSF